MFLLGYNRKNIDRWFAQKYDMKQNFGYFNDKYPDTISGFQQSVFNNYKWISSSLVTFLFCFISVGIIAVIFGKKQMQIVSYMYLIALVGVITLIIIGNIVGSYKMGYGLAQNIKKIIQTPVLTLFFILYFWKINPQK
jgi:hypothetical protein